MQLPLVVLALRLPRALLKRLVIVPPFLSAVVLLSLQLLLRQPHLQRELVLQT
jgi:hypothetical protein